MRDDGGPAFPIEQDYVSFKDEDGNVRFYRDEGEQPTGMTLRDYFAAKAMQGLLMRFGTMSEHVTDQNLSRLAYMYADDMIKERAK